MGGIEQDLENVHYLGIEEELGGIEDLEVSYSLKLREVNLQNFRCFSHLKFKFEETLTTFIGSNSAGKSTVLQAILKLLSSSPKDRILEKSDIYNHDRVNDKEGINCRIELIFEIPEGQELFNLDLDRYLPDYSYSDEEDRVYI
ncbi:AAA family ATPase [Bacillus toyonensis]|uniref:AAA family ATPase n=1 Tax=Bacillus toyonensis TaxID=155322 RepID=UPI0021D036B3|nr:AAA family ATPase [Bacillus toyonensis]MCU5395974.1 AAA family ATPase [Bacillus toyonensis]